MKDSWAIGLLATLSLLFMLALGWQIRDRVLAGQVDFAQLYGGARLAGTPDLYNPDRIKELQRESAGMTSEWWRYVRPPYYAALLSPLGRLPYRTAYAVWQLLALASLAGFVWLWRPPHWKLNLLYLCLSFPVFAGLFNGQDLALTLFWITLGIWCLRRGKPLLAGSLFALCAAKFHLFLWLPAFIWGRKLWRFGAGLLLGGAVLTAVSFAAGGLDWPQQYYAALTAPGMDTDVGHMPNLRGLFFLWPSLSFLQWFFYPLIGLAVGIVARRMPLEYALAATLAGGLLTGYHSYVPDCALLLPAGLAVVSTTASRLLRILAILLLLPFGYLLLLVDSPWPALVPAAVILMILLMAREAWRARTPAPQPSVSAP